MAPPTGELDGDPRWFETGQSIEEPGLARTPFGIPVNCTGPEFMPCSINGLTHFRWQIEFPLGTPFGTSFLISDNTVGFTTTLFPGLTWILRCSIWPWAPDVPSLAVIVNSVLPTPAIMGPANLVDPTPVYSFEVYSGPRPPQPVFVRWLPDP